MDILPEMFESLTICIPVRIDCEERRDNLLTVIDYLSALQCRIIVLEADSQPQTSDLCKTAGIGHYFVKDTNRVFHRTHYINKLLQMVKTEVAAIWDTDVLVEYGQILTALQIIQRGATISYPYDGKFIMLSEQLSKQVRRKVDLDYLKSLKMKPLLGRKLFGGVYLVHRQRYLQCGGENERFTGWGPEDAERWHRVVILGEKICHIPSGELYHLYHKRGNNSSFQSKEDARRLREEFIRVCCMSRNELKSYITNEEHS